MSESRSGDADKFASAIPWGVYVPPRAPVSTYRAGNVTDVASSTRDGEDADGGVPRRAEEHGGYVRIVDARGKKFPCGFSRPMGSATEAAVGKKRAHSQMTRDGSAKTDADGSACDGTQDSPSEATNGENGKQQKATITEERLHPEEALFLHMRGLLRIERSTGGEEAANGSSSAAAAATCGSAMSTQDLFCQVLPQCGVLMAAYLAYAHLRAQGYLLMRYSEKRLGLLRRLGDADSDSISQTDRSVNGEGNASKRARIARFDDRRLRKELSDDVATAPPPCVVNLKEDGDKGKPTKIQLAYYAYNPNSRFKRSNPGLPNFGVAAMPFRSNDGNGPTFDVLNSLVANCEGGASIPLRVVTVADGGAAIAFGVTRGDVPSINDRKNAKDESG